MNTLEQEVRTLQKQVRRQRGWNFSLGALLLVAGCTAATSTQSVPDVVRAKKFEVVNDKGNVLVHLTSSLALTNNAPVIDGVGYGVIETRGENGGALTRIWGDSSGGNFEIRNGRNTRLASIGSNTNGDGLITTRSSTGQELVTLESPEDGGFGIVTTKNRKGGVLVLLSADTGGKGVVVTENGKGGRLVELGSTTGGNGLVETKNGKGQTLVELGSTTGGRGVVETKNGKGQTLVLLTSGDTDGTGGAHIFGNGQELFRIYGNTAKGYFEGKTITYMGKSTAGTGLFGIYDDKGQFTSLNP